MKWNKYFQHASNISFIQKQSIKVFHYLKPQKIKIVNGKRKHLESIKILVQLWRFYICTCMLKIIMNVNLVLNFLII
jgi:hypothetical protein